MRYIPNILTFLRLLLVFPLLLLLSQQYYGWALICLGIAGATDVLDGFLARTFNWESRLGSIWDPIADKVLLVSSFVALSFMNLIPFWLLILVISRDIYISVGAVAYYWVLGKFRVTPHWTGKLNAFVQTLLILSILIHLSLAWLNSYVILSLTYIVCGACIASILQYSWIWGRRAQFALKERRYHE